MMERDGTYRVFGVAALALLLTFWAGAATTLAQDDDVVPADEAEATAALDPTPATAEPAPAEDAAAHDSDFLANFSFDAEVAVLADNSWWSWLFLMMMIFVGLAVGKIVGSTLRKMGDGFDGRGWRARGEFFTDAAGPAQLLIFTLALSSGLLQLTMGEAVADVAKRAITLLIYICIIWYAFNLVALVEVVLRRFTDKSESKLDDQLVPIIRKTLRIFLVVVSTLYIAQNIFGQQIGAWLAGLGIAGLAVSLAAQDSLKNLFGSVAILLDRPFQVGERIKYRDIDGTVEEIGFRSVKVRTLTGHLVTVPNSNIVNDPVENITKRPTIRRLLNVTITYDTPPAKIREAVQILRDILASEGIREPIHPTVNGAELPPRVYFNDFNADSLNIFVMYWFAPAAWWDFLEHAERVNMLIFEKFEAADIDFAFPTQTIHLANDSKRQLAVRMLSEQNDAPLPFQN